MMNQKFSTYNWEELLEAEEFVRWILYKENNSEWRKLTETYPEFAKEAKRAREIILVLQDKYDVLDENSIGSLWNNIEQYYYETKIPVRKLNFRKALGWAASILLIFSIGVAAYYIIDSKATYSFSASAQEFEGEAYFLLSTGERIALGQENSTIEIKETEQNFIVNNKTIRRSDYPRLSTKPQLNEIVVPFGQQSEVTLADGTVIWINAGSKLAFPSEFSKNNRLVHIEGEAAFQVAKNERKPFIVRTSDGLDIEVLGTLFNVSAYPEQEIIETVLINGRVAINKPGFFNNSPVELSPNKKAEFNKLNQEIEVSDEPNATIYIAWVKGWLEYQKESLNSVLVKLERYYDVKFHLPADFPADDKITGKLDLKESLENVLQVLSDAAQVEYEIKGKEIFIQSKIRNR
ncbi:MAG TPA: FecR domain-containing protein [Mariniphaga sp.]|nr:FecR domain-containing protein [Mariniphaga sp.]